MNQTTNEISINALMIVMKNLPLLRSSDIGYVTKALGSILQIREFYHFDKAPLKSEL